MPKREVSRAAKVNGDVATHPDGAGYMRVVDVVHGLEIALAHIVLGVRGPLADEHDLPAGFLRRT